MLEDGTEIEPEDSEAKSIHTKIFLTGIFFAAYWAIGSTIQNEDHGHHEYTCALDWHKTYSTINKILSCWQRCMRVK